MHVSKGLRDLAHIYDSYFSMQLSHSLANGMPGLCITDDDDIYDNK